MLLSSDAIRFKNHLISRRLCAASRRPIRAPEGPPAPSQVLSIKLSLSIPVYLRLGLRSFLPIQRWLLRMRTHLMS